MDDAVMPLLLMSAFRGLADTTRAALAEAGFEGVRATHGFAMQAIGDGCTGVELARRLGVSKQAAAKTARQLEELGLVTRTGQPGDRRAQRLVPTPRGHEMLARSAASFRAQVARWRACLGDAAVDATLRTLANADPGDRGPSDLSHWA